MAVDSLKSNLNKISDTDSKLPRKKTPKNSISDNLGMSSYVSAKLNCYQSRFLTELGLFPFLFVSYWDHSKLDMKARLKTDNFGLGFGVKKEFGKNAIEAFCDVSKLSFGFNVVS